MRRIVEPVPRLRQVVEGKSALLPVVECQANARKYSTVTKIMTNEMASTT
jgi:hypothetical protein